MVEGVLMTFVCNRGHERLTGRNCPQCQRVREKGRHLKRHAYMKQWREDFKLAFGVSAGTAYRKRAT